jgi:signal transduction histidine kinase
MEIVTGSTRAFWNPFGRVSATLPQQVEHEPSGSRVRDDVIWLLVFLLGWTIAILLVARGGIGAFVALIVVGVLTGLRIGTLIEEQRHLRAETVAVAAIMEGIAPAGTVREAVQTALRELLSLFGARAILLVAHDRGGGRLHSWQARTDMLAAQHEELPVSQAPTYVFAAPTDAWYAERPAHAGARRPSTKALWPDQLRARRAAIDVPDAFLAAHPFESVLVVTTSFGGQWEDRLFVIDAKVGSRPLRLLRAIATRIGPAIHMLDLVGQLGSRVGAAARARVARELHDGVIQSLIGLEMEVEVWRRSAASEDPSAGDRLARIQQVLRGEILDLRDLMQQLKPPSIDSAQILEYLADLVGRFQQQTGIVAHFASEIEDLDLSPRVCGEVARIVQEALVNVRKHSGAKTVLVRVSAPDGYWKFEIDDDGRGFGFAGRHSHADLEIGRKGPVVIKERVRSIGGTLAVESAPGQGARVEIWLPRTTHG